MTSPLATAEHAAEHADSQAAGVVELPQGTTGAERKGWFEQPAPVAFIAVPFAAILLADARRATS